MTEKQQIEFIRENYLTISTKRIAMLIGRSCSFVCGRLKKMGLIIPVSILLERKQKSMFKKRDIPWNKGIKSLRVSIATEFKPGNKPANTLYDNAIVLRKHKQKDGKIVHYKFIRTSLGIWAPLHRFIWEKEYGKVPQGMVVRFIDGNSRNVKLNNLILVTRAQNAIMNKAVFKKKGRSYRKTDKYIAGIISSGDKILGKELLKNKVLLDLKRAELLLRKAIKKCS